MNLYLMFQISPCLHKSTLHIILVITEIKVIISNKTHPKYISLFLSRVGASVVHNLDNFNLLLCLHLNITSLRSFSSCLRSLKLVILIFSSIHKLHLALKLFAIEDCLFSTLLEGLFGGARGVMVIVAGYGHGDTSSKPGPDWLHFT